MEWTIPINATQKIKDESFSAEKNRALIIKISRKK